MKNIKYFLQFVFTPSKKRTPKKTSFFVNLGKVLSLLVFLLIIDVIFFLIEDSLISAGVLLEPQQISSDIGKNAFVLIFGSVIYAPLIEEITCRGWIIYNRLYIALFSVALFIDVIGRMFLGIKLFATMESTCITFFVAILIFTVVFLALKKVRITFIKRWNSHTRMLFFISSFLFGYLHIFNYVITPNLVLFSPLIIFPHIMAGFIMGYLRIELGFMWGYAFHLIVNSISVLLTLLL